MPYYNRLRFHIKDDAQRARAVDNLIKLRAQLDGDIPVKDIENNLLLATWNIRDFGKAGNRRGFGKRLPETHFYIAEVISRFDFVAVQEVNQLPEWERVMDILGREWDYIATDVTDPKIGGNGERLTYVFDKRKVWFQNIAGEIVLPPDMLISKAEFEISGKKVTAGKQFRRTPFLASFQSGWFKFDICTVHLYFGDDSGPKLDERVEEIGQVASYFGRRADETADRQGRSLILLGDFNIVSPTHKTMEALLDQDFSVPKALRQKTNIGDTKFYDQIAFKTKPEVLDYIEKTSGAMNKRNAGAFKIFESIFTDSNEDFELYKADAKASPNGSDKSGDELRKYYRQWRTYQFSDHRPLWVRLKTNDSQAYLERLKGAA